MDWFGDVRKSFESDQSYEDGVGVSVWVMILVGLISVEVSVPVGSSVPRVTAVSDGVAVDSSFVDVLVEVSVAVSTAAVSDGVSVRTTLVSSVVEVGVSSISWKSACGYGLAGMDAACMVCIFMKNASMSSTMTIVMNLISPFGFIFTPFIYERP